MRRATAADVEALAAFNAAMHAWPNPDAGNPELADWVRDLLGGGHPTTGASDALLVEEAGSGAIVSASCLIPQTWSYGGVPLGVGRPELIATAPAYRRRGLIRAQMGELHAWSAARGDRLQAITGIPWFYRQFGYEPALALDAGRFVDAGNLPKPPADAPGPYTLRPAAEADLPFIAATYDAGMRRYLVAARRDVAQWRHELLGHHPGSVYARRLHIATAAGEPVGFVAHWPALWSGDTLVVSAWEVCAGLSWLAVAPGVLRALRATGEALAAGSAAPFRRFLLLLGTAHPAYDALPGHLAGGRRPYSWQLRVADLPAFLRRVAPVLERRLATSPIAGHSGGLTLSFFRDGLRLTFADGRLTTVTPWTPTGPEAGDALFPDRTFLQLLFGHRSVAELGDAFADCWVEGEGGALLHALFPPAVSEVWPVS